MVYLNVDYYLLSIYVMLWGWDVGWFCVDVVLKKGLNYYFEFVMVVNRFVV